MLYLVSYDTFHGQKWLSMCKHEDIIGKASTCSEDDVVTLSNRLEYATNNHATIIGVYETINELLSTKCIIKEAQKKSSINEAEEDFKIGTLLLMQTNLKDIYSMLDLKNVQQRMIAAKVQRVQKQLQAIYSLYKERQSIIDTREDEVVSPTESIQSLPFTAESFPPSEPIPTKVRTPLGTKNVFANHNTAPKTYPTALKNRNDLTVTVKPSQSTNPMILNGLHIIPTSQSQSEVGNTDGEVITFSDWVTEQDESGQPVNFSQSEKRDSPNIVLGVSNQQLDTSENKDPNNENKTATKKMITLKNGTQIPQSLLDDISFLNYSVATRRISEFIFGRDVLRTHTLTGKQSPAFIGKSTKPGLDQAKVQDIIDFIAEKCAVHPAMVRSKITSLCSDLAKPPRKKKKLELHEY